jgi:hypothetical protein
MTTAEANQFVSDVLRALWSRWDPGDEEIRGWTDRLTKFDYGRAQKAVNDLFFTTVSRVAPPPDKVFAVLYKHAFIKPRKGSNDPVHLYTIIKESKLGNVKFGMGGERFYVGTSAEVPDKEEIVRRAERDREVANRMYGEPHVIIYPKIEGKESLL